MKVSSLEQEVAALREKARRKELDQNGQHKHKETSIPGRLLTGHELSTHTYILKVVILILRYNFLKFESCYK